VQNINEDILSIIISRRYVNGGW